MRKSGRPDLRLERAAPLVDTNALGRGVVAAGTALAPTVSRIRGERPLIRRELRSRRLLRKGRREVELAARQDKKPDAYLTAVPPTFHPRPPSPKISWPVAVTATVSSSLMKPRFGCLMVVSTEITMPGSSGRSASVAS